MKFLGYNRIHGEKDGKSYDFVQLIIEKEDAAFSSEKGGVQIVMARSSKGYGLPTVSQEQFLEALKSGLKGGDEVQLYRDFEGNTIFEKV